MKIAITGASGFIGKSLFDELLSMGHEISILTRKGEFPVPCIKIVKGDLLSDKSDFQVLIDGVDAIYHCAGEIKDESLMAELHIGGTRRMLDAVRKSIKKNKKPLHWIQLSSVGAYGIDGPDSHRKRIINEQSPESPLGIYEITKTASDQLVREFASQEPLFSFTIIRPTIVIGSKMPNESFHAMARMIKRGLFFRIGRNEAIANYVHLDDVVGALIKCLNDPRSKGSVFIISNDCPLTDVVTAFANSMRVPVPKWVMPEALLRLLVGIVGPWVRLPLTIQRIDALTRQTHYSSKLIYEILGYLPSASIPEIIPKLVDESAERLLLN